MSDIFIKRELNKSLFNKGIISVSKISNINQLFDYVDEEPNGDMDTLLVSCGQYGHYNELQYIYDEKLKRFINNNVISEQQAIHALASACFNIDNPRSRKDFYAHLAEKLDITIE
ncbi:hypothetical protein ABMY44_04745 [Pseudoalteromonas sp. Cnat2-41]|uniref:hypothetical protein n=1 Tax=unclassified Pseudoalteromonas TaxID=194690 RepID=UPI001EF8BDA5|nr:MULTISPECIES: hypothetical protein [unclassified Pseudoalteromonas]MCF2861464.1 hypothetical protein [Pseudoalteromonas sp. CNAT2-18]MCG7557497.1 hypothetical protein [Pseudoalteromonas sp. CNAT2-18.1]